MGLNTTPRTWVAGEVVTAAMLNTEVRDAITGIEAAWPSYTPAWTSTGTAPAIGNGSLTGGYLQIGKTFMFRLLLTVGTTTSFGTGVLSLSLPGTPRAGSGIWTWKGVAVDASVAQYEWNLQWSGAGTTCLMLYPNTGVNTLVAVSGTAPWTAGNADTYSVQGYFEGA